MITRYFLLDVMAYLAMGILMVSIGYSADSWQYRAALGVVLFMQMLGCEKAMRRK